MQQGGRQTSGQLRMTLLRVREYQITGRKKSLLPAKVAGRDDFVVRPGDEVNFSELWQTQRTNLTPYCLDHQKREVIFVWTPTKVDLLRVHPFFYEAQRQHAERLYAVPYTSIPALATKLPKAEVVFLHSTGRCGSTLVSKLFGHAPMVQSVSEPDIYSQVAVLSNTGVLQKSEELGPVLSGCTALLCAHLLCRQPARTTVVIKTRGMCIYIAKLLKLALPESKAMFLYRDPVATINSFIGAMVPPKLLKISGLLGFNRLRISWLARMPHVAAWLKIRAPILRYKRRIRTEFSKGWVGFFAVGWVSMMDHALRLILEDARFFSLILRYEDLEKYALPMMEKIFVDMKWGELGPDGRKAMKATLGKHSQSGSAIESKGEFILSDSDIRQVESLLLTHPEISGTGYVLPGTLSV